MFVSSASLLSAESFKESGAPSVKMSQKSRNNASAWNEATENGLIHCRGQYTGLESQRKTPRDEAGITDSHQRRWRHGGIFALMPRAPLMQDVE